jgi:hypothetical protein
VLHERYVAIEESDFHVLGRRAFLTVIFDLSPSLPLR